MFLRVTLYICRKTMFFRLKPSFSQKNSVFLRKTRKPCFSDKHCLSTEKQCSKNSVFLRKAVFFKIISHLADHIAKQSCSQEKPVFYTYKYKTAVVTMYYVLGCFRISLFCRINLHRWIGVRLGPNSTHEFF